jgi:threonine dehydrogenase-like Zn-dependent dehydrogenase
MLWACGHGYRVLALPGWTMTFIAVGSLFPLSAVSASSRVYRVVTIPSRSIFPLAASGKIDLDGMVTTRYTLDEAETALSQNNDPTAMKVIVQPGKTSTR